MDEGVKYELNSYEIVLGVDFEILPLFIFVL